MAENNEAMDFRKFYDGFLKPRADFGKLVSSASNGDANSRNVLRNKTYEARNELDVLGIDVSIGSVDDVKDSQIEVYSAFKQADDETKAMETLSGNLEEIIGGANGEVLSQIVESEAFAIGAKREERKTVLEHFRRKESYEELEKFVNKYLSEEGVKPRTEEQISILRNAAVQGVYEALGRMDGISDAKRQVLAQFYNEAIRDGNFNTDKVKGYAEKGMKKALADYKERIEGDSEEDILKITKDAIGRVVSEKDPRLNRAMVDTFYRAGKQAYE